MSNETVNERKARESAERIAAHKQATARPTLPTRDDLTDARHTDYTTRRNEEEGRVEAFRRAQIADFLRRKLGRVPTPAEIDEATDGR